MSGLATSLGPLALQAFVKGLDANQGGGLQTPRGKVFLTESSGGVRYFLTETVNGVTYYLTESA